MTTPPPRSTTVRSTPSPAPAAEAGRWRSAFWARRSAHDGQAGGRRGRRQIDRHRGPEREAVDHDPRRGDAEPSEQGLVGGVGVAVDPGLVGDAAAGAEAAVVDRQHAEAEALEPGPRL